MKLKLITLTFFILLCTLLFWREGQIMPQTEGINTTFSELTLTSLSGKNISLGDTLTDNIHLHFWATWCAPCVEELPALVSYAAKQSNLTIFAISTDATPSIITPFLKKLHIDPQNTKNILWMQDPTQEVTNNIFRVYKFPETLILDKNYQLKERLSGAQEWD